MTNLTLTNEEIATVGANLECGCSVDELRAFHGKYEPSADEATRNLAVFASLKASAVEHRLAGRIEAAVRFETRCEGVYSRLPESARW